MKSLRKILITIISHDYTLIFSEVCETDNLTILHGFLWFKKMKQQLVIKS
jgi:hypothetical protein